MTAHFAPSGIIEGLQRLSDAIDVPATQRDAACRLCDRLSAPVDLCICGPLPEVCQFVKAGLDRAGLTSSGLINLTCHSALPSSVDIVIWVTFVFDEAEATTWNGVSDPLKDRSFLVSLVPDAGQSAITLSDLLRRAAGDFDTVLAIPMQDSTGAFADLARRLSQRARDGRNADIDAALLLMDRFKELVAALPQAPAPEPVVASVPCPALKEAEALLQAHAEALKNVPINEDKNAIAGILQSCVKTTDTLCDLLAQSDSADLCADAMLAQDDIVLMSLEENLSSAADAVTTLLHLRRDLQCELAS